MMAAMSEMNRDEWTRRHRRWDLVTVVGGCGILAVILSVLLAFLTGGHW